MSVRESIPVERPCGDCGAIFTPAVLTWPDPKRDKCAGCSDAFIRSMFAPTPSTKERDGA